VRAAPLGECVISKTFYLLTIYLFFCFISVCADDFNDLDPVVVSATRWETFGINTANSISVITYEDIQKSGALNVTEVLRGQGGIQITDQYGDGSRSTVSMRGFGANAQSNTLIMVDGRRLNNTDLRAPDLNTISLKDVERIEIIQGSSTVLFGDQAVGGVINIITRHQSENKIELSGAYGSYDTQLQSVIVNDRFANGFSYRLTGQRLLSNNYRDNNDRTYTNAFANVDYQWEEGNAFIEFQRVDEDLKLPGSLFIDQVKDDRKQTRFPNDFNDTETEIARIGSSFFLSHEWQVRAEFTNRRENIDGILTNIQFMQERHTQSFNPRIRGYLPLFNTSVVFGSDLEETDYNILALFGFGPAITNSTQNTESVYAQAIIPFDEYLTVTIGARKAWMENNIVDSFSFPAGMTLKDDQFAATYGLTLKPLPHLRMFMRKEDIYRFPLVDEETFVPFGTTGLETQTGESYEAGLEWSTPAWFAKITGYRLKLENEIDFDPIAGGFGANTNLDPTERTGLIVEGGLYVNAKLSFAAFYNYIDAEFSEGTFSGNKIPLVAEQQLLLTGNYSLNDYFQFHGEFFTIDERVATGDFANSFQHLAGYGVFNANVIFRYMNLEISGRINNLLDNEYNDFAATAFNPVTFGTETGFSPARERNYLLTLSYNL
jgi:iron complex outermembrane receptor protein